VKNEDQDQPHTKEDEKEDEDNEEEEAVVPGVFSKVQHVVITNTLCLPKLARHGASWPVMHEKRSHACPVLALHAGRAGK